LDFRLAVLRLGEDLRAVARFLGLRAAVVRLRVVRLRVGRLAVLRLRDVPFRFRVAAAFLAARDRTADLRLRVAAAFLAPVERFRDVVFLRAVDFLRDADFLRVVAMCHLPPTLRTPCASGVAALARSCPPTRRTARRDATRS
jgi:hypothetical protein